jgi:hypothetical protein
MNAQRDYFLELNFVSHPAWIQALCPPQPSRKLRLTRHGDRGKICSEENLRKMSQSQLAPALHPSTCLLMSTLPACASAPSTRRKHITSTDAAGNFVMFGVRVGK